MWRDLLQLTWMVCGTASAAQAMVKTPPPWISGVFVSEMVMFVSTGRAHVEGVVDAISAHPWAMSDGTGKEDVIRSGERPPLVLLSKRKRGGRADERPPWYTTSSSITIKLWRDRCTYHLWLTSATRHPWHKPDVTCMRRS